ncbi:hypothetical protein BH925_06120 [Rodentibacter pneumotropicus]|uniref:host specificity protein J n=2 Tax=Rodentibacter pneumotropicus TaxID=758 RepID=UPI0009899AFD|nr:phage tail protein [Rodentibacter pneumotropicus]OOF64648.1 hypothetical protein BH925_06120 [Rodentibacter pneumotropicus]
MGKGGGGGGRTPVEAKESGRSKQLVKIVEIISEGEIEGLADGMKSVYLDNTPIQNTDGSYNFSNVQLEGRVGSQVQEIIPGFNTSEKEINVGTQVRKTTPITRTVTDSKVSRLRLTLGVQSLFQQNDQGDTNSASVSLTVYIGNQSYPITISGKYSSQYLQQHTFSNLPAVPFTVRVERNTADSKSQRLQNNTVWASYTEIIDTEFTYPNTALIGVKFDSEYFSNIPNRTYDVKGIKVKVPSNYDPKTRQYRGMWDGTFKIEWSDNPAWVLYDIVTNKRYGLGQRLGDFGADKWALYQVAQYCDQLVPDGFGGKEPRFTCNAWLTDQRPAYDVINDICSIFRAMPVWNGRELTVVMDRPSDPVWTYTNANVENGEFTYTFSAKKSRHNALQVEYADKDNAYEKTIEYVSDDESIRRNGLNVKKITAFGCTSRGQAHRTGLWLLQTEKLETKTVTFTVGAEGLMHVPGDIIKVADIDYAGTNIGGRVLKIAGRKVILDREIDITANSYFTYINAQAKHQDIKILSVNESEITLDSEPVGLVEYGVWSLTTQRINAQLFRALSVQEDAKGKYTIIALQHEPQKEAIVDNGAVFEPKATSILSVPSVNDIQIITNEDGSVGINADVSGGNGLVKYDILIYKGDNLFDVRLGLKSPELDLSNLANGEYLVVIRARNEKGQLLNERTQGFLIDRPPVPTGVRATGGLGNITLEWDWINEATATEIFAAETDNLSKAKRIAKVTAQMYSHEVGAKQVRYYWLRHTRGINVGPFHQQSGLRAESAVDIDAELDLLNEKLSQNIVNEVIDTALPARNLELIQTVTGLDVNTFTGYKQVHNTADGKLYTWNGSKYLDNSVDVAKLQIPTKQLTGTLTAQQIGANVIGTQHLGANTITADKMAADSVSTAALQAGAVRASHVASGELTADKLAIGLGGNLLYNPIFANNGNGWSMYVDGNNIDNADWGFNNTTGAYQGGAYLPTELKFRWQRNRKNTNSGNVRLGGLYQDLKLVKDKYYCFSAYVGAHRAFIDLNIEHGSTQLIKKSWSGRGKSGGYGNNNSDTGIEENLRIYMIFKATGDNATYRMIINMWANGTQNNPAMLVRRPMLEECTQYTTQPSPWQNAGVTAIHGGSIVTNTITAQQIAANTITSNQIAAGTIAARNMAANSINASHVVSKSLTADKLSVSNLAAISANLGNITGGSLNINNQFKVSAQGQVEMRASAGNVGMVMNNNQIIVYDSDGKVRVKIGLLS